MLLGALFGFSAMAIVALLAVMLWTGGRDAGPRIGAESPIPAFPQPGYASNPYGSHTAMTGGGPTASLLPTATDQPPGATAASRTADSEPHAPASTAARSQTPHGSGEPKTLRAGDQGPEVTTLQRLLFQQGFTYVDTTGIFDDATARGVAQLQRDRSLSCDPPGVYGPCTRAALTG
ncbi:peptidoglycan-binding domain-containing protein [Kitasatospora atroaurantiaca]|uniref:peptidoglycan-binding domain-containing protein n=1 Tax=Kitasatospora atroaurantiaca TaxID=285545 RepID=UPI0014781007|nr:peptidoglycan-binding domain-containing protein [Kitasatospora atroaurantiaca]